MKATSNASDMGWQHRIRRGACIRKWAPRGYACGCGAAILCCQGGCTAPPANVEPLAIRAEPLEGDDVSGVEPLLLDEAAPPFGEDVALAAVPVWVPEPPHLPCLILEAQLQPLLALKRKVALGVLLGYHQPVQLPNITWRQRLLKQGLPLPITHQLTPAIVFIVITTTLELGRTQFISHRRIIASVSPRGTWVAIEWHGPLIMGLGEDVFELRGAEMTPLAFWVFWRQVLDGHTGIWCVRCYPVMRIQSKWGKTK